MVEIPAGFFHAQFHSACAHGAGNLSGKELSFLNLTAFADSAESTISIPLVGDAFDSIHMEYTDMLRGQLSRGSNGMAERKEYLSELQKRRNEKVRR